MPLCKFCQQTVAVSAERCPHCGVWLRQGEEGTRPADNATPALDEAAESEIRSLLTQNRKIEAIKTYRELTGVGLAEAKYAVERMAQGTSADDASIPGNVKSEVLELLMAGQKIQAIKIYRKQTGLGLKESKEAVEALAARNGIAPQRVGCVGVLVVMVAVSAVLIGWLK